MLACLPHTTCFTSLLTLPPARYGRSDFLAYRIPSVGRLLFSGPLRRLCCFGGIRFITFRAETVSSEFQSPSLIQSCDHLGTYPRLQTHIPAQLQIPSLCTV